MMSDSVVSIVTHTQLGVFLDYIIEEQSYSNVTCE